MRGSSASVTGACAGQLGRAIVSRLADIGAQSGDVVAAYRARIAAVCAWHMLDVRTILCFDDSITCRMVAGQGSTGAVGPVQAAERVVVVATHPTRRTHATRFDNVCVQVSDYGRREGCLRGCWDGTGGSRESAQHGREFEFGGTSEENASLPSPRCRCCVRL